MSDAAPSESRPRLTDVSLPLYSYVPGHAPHPVSDPRGHMYGHGPVAVAPLELEVWRSSATYLYALDLFNHGFYWEAHEAWESLWHAAGRVGPTAVWLKALIKLAAAGVKAREGNSIGVERHARRCLALIDELRGSIGAEAMYYGGLALGGVARVAEGFISQAAEFRVPRPTLLLPWWFTPADC